MNFRIRIFCPLLCAIVIAIGATGCTSVAGLGKKVAKVDGRLNPLKTLQVEKGDDFVAPASMVAIWKASVFEKPGQKTLRGFGGRFYFYDAQNEPVKVDGDLMIYGYDDDNKSDSSGAKADRKFVFKADTINSHFSESALGASYSFWVPWDEVGGVEKTITLIPVFKSTEGRMPEAKPSTMRLPGKKKSAVALEQVATGAEGGVKHAYGVVPERSMIRQTGFVGEPLGTASRRATTTLRMTRSMADRMARTHTRHRRAMPVDSEAKDEAVTAASTDVPKFMPPVQQARPTTDRTAVFGQPGAFH